MTVEECIKERRSTRSFSSEMPSREDIEKIVEAGAYAPSAMNEQPWTFTVIKNAKKLDELNGIVKALMSAADEERIRSRAADNKFNFFYKAPVLIIVSCGEARFPEADAACALENMFLQAHALGLGTCWINQLCGAANDDGAVRAFLSAAGVPATDRVYGCCAVGYTENKTELKPRRAKVNYIE